MSPRTIGWGALCSLLCAACARGPNVASDELALRRVVVYRNGVGYFERTGQVSDDRVSFRMRQRMVGDFLASLAVINPGQGAVRSASFLLELEEQAVPSPEPSPPDPGSPLPRPLYPESPRVAPAPSEPDPDAMRTVVLHLDGEEHALSIGYLAETPVWRPSYRVVLGDDGHAALQAWGIVQNLSGEDWQGVSLALVAGAPLAFQSTLGTPVIPERPIVTDRGEVVAVVPTSVTSLEQRPPAAPSAPEMEVADASEADEEIAPERLSAQKRRALGASTPMSGAVAVAPAPSPPPMPTPTRAPVSQLAAVAVDSGTTRYELPYPVTVPNESATMVLLTSAPVPGEAVLLFAPEPGVRDSEVHPFRVARFQNATRGLLERGPIAVFERGAFLGQGLLEPLPPGATATVPFAIERSVALVREHRHDERAARLYRIEAGKLWLERDAVDRSLYRIENGGSQASKLLVEHPRIHGSRLHQPPPGTEDNTANGAALIPVRLAANAKTELVVEERRGVQRQVDWLDPIAELAVQDYLADPLADRAFAERLREVWVIRGALKRAHDESRKIDKERSELERQSADTRASLRAIEKNPGAADLRARLTARLDEAGKRLDALTRRNIELSLTIGEQEVRFRDAVQSLRFDTPLPPKD